MSAPLHIVWFKRDLRIRDHKPLYEAHRNGAVLPLYIIEPSVIHADDFDPCHWTFLRASLLELRENLARLGQPLVVRVGEAVEVLEQLRQAYPTAALYAHEETGNAITYARDRAVRRWAREHGIAVHEYWQTGVVRPLRDRDGWAAIWEARMHEPTTPDVGRLIPIPDIEIGDIPAHETLKLGEDVRIEAQPGGEIAAQTLLTTFLYRRGYAYQRAMSSPNSAETACSRLSPHLAWGTISIKTAYQASIRRADESRAMGETSWVRAMNSFSERLHWHCHFMQKLEDEPVLEFQSFIPEYDRLRDDYQPSFLDAWTHGMTGFPMIDACMRALMRLGWLNFRMRAMIVSFASYDLWLPWQKTALSRPAVWLDFEAGIHYSQFQMQSGTTGINTLRVYSPIKQSMEQDPNGAWIRRFVPELATVPDSFIHMPWLMPIEMQRQVGCIIGKTYPAPLVEHESAQGMAKDRITALRRLPEMQAAADAVRARHGSRRVWKRRPVAKPRKNAGMLLLPGFGEGE